VKARSLIENEELKAELLDNPSPLSVLSRHGLESSDHGQFDKPGWGNNNFATVHWNKYVGLVIPMTPAPDVSVVVTTWDTPKWQTNAATIELVYGSKGRKATFSYNGADDYDMVRKLDMALTKLKLRLSLYKPRTERGLDKIITTLGYR